MPPTCEILCSTTSPTAGAAFSRSWAALCCSWAALGRYWGAPGPLLVALGPLLAALVPPLAALGPLLAALGPLLERHAEIHKISTPKMIDLGSPKPPQDGPRIRPETIKNRCKKRSDKKIRYNTKIGLAKSQKTYQNQ